MGMRLYFYRVTEAEADEFLANPESLYDDYEAIYSSDRFMDIDKAWHGLHFLLTGTEWEGDPPACYLLSGGQPFGEGVLDYGGHILNPGEVAEFAQFLESTTDARLRARFAPNRMAELSIYPAIWDRPEEEDDTLGYLMEYFGQLRDFVGTAAGEKQAMLIWMA